MDKIIAWWSGGVTSAVAVKLAIDLYGAENVRPIFIDTKNEHIDTYRFMEDCAVWYGVDIGTLSRIGQDIKTKKGTIQYSSISDVWDRYSSLNVAHGAICSSDLKREVRTCFEKENEFRYQVFGFDADEPKRAKALKMNYPNSKPIFPLLLHQYSKEDCIEIVKNAGIDIPAPYMLGLVNNNCFQTGCVQGGIWYWQKFKALNPEAWEEMAEREHRYTNLKGHPVTMLKDQSKEAKESGRMNVFLKKHPDYPDFKTVFDIKGRPPKKYFECNGFCGVEDLESKSDLPQGVNYQPTLF